MLKFQIKSSDMIKLRVYWVSWGVMCHVEVMLPSYKIKLVIKKLYYDARSTNHKKNTVCNCIYMYVYLTACSMPQWQCRIILFFIRFVNLFFKILIH